MDDKLGRKIKIDDIVLWLYYGSLYYGRVNKILKVNVGLKEVIIAQYATNTSPAVVQQQSGLKVYKRKGTEVIIMSPHLITG